MKERGCHTGSIVMVKSEMKVFRSAIFHCTEVLGVVQASYFEDGLLLVRDGKVVEVGDYSSVIENVDADANIIHFENSLLMPGFIDSHLHYPQYKVIASYGQNLLEWLSSFTFPEEKQFGDKEYATRVGNLFFDELIRNGTTTAMAFCTTHPQSVDTFFTIAKERKLRMAAGKVLMDRNAPEELLDIGTDYQDSRSLIERWHNKERLSYAVTPRFAPTSSKEQLTMAAGLLKEYSNSNGRKGVLLQTHLNESTEEVEWVKDLYPDCDNYFDVYDSYNLTGSNSVFAHCIHNTEDEYKRMADSNSRAALCPNSNLFLGSGLFDIQKLDYYGITSSLSSDIGGGDSFSMFSVMNQAYKVSKLNGQEMSPVKAFYLCTLAGAKALNMDDSIGNFEKNKEADFVVLDLHATELISERLKTVKNIEQLLFCLMMLGDDRLIGEVYILGDCIYKKMEA
jgi:guanine deaminase